MQPEAFGLHENADISKDLAQTDAVTSALLLCGGGGGGGASGGAAEARVAAMVDDITSKLPAPFDIEKAQSKFPVSYEESMNNVLCQEMLRYNRLTAIIRTSLAGLSKALKGLQVRTKDSCRQIIVFFRIKCFHKSWAFLSRTRLTAAYFV